MTIVVYSTEILLNTATVRDVNGEKKHSGLCAITARTTNNQTNSESKHSIEFTYSDFPCHLKMNRDKLVLINH